MALVRGAPITVRCDCGDVQHVPYGETWECPTCGKRWNTTQIPAEQYWGIMEDMRRFRLQVMGIAVAIAVPFALLGLFVGQRFFLLFPLVLGFWFFFFMPQWRRKVRAATRSLPTWHLRPE
jgi:hypothetical protein